MLLSIFFFILAGLAEIGGGYLVWLYMRDDKGPVYLLAGAIILFLYGLIPTFQPEASFGKVYAAYGGVFIALSILWGWLVDGLRPDTYDIIGGLVCLVGRLYHHVRAALNTKSTTATVVLFFSMSISMPIFMSITNIF